MSLSAPARGRRGRRTPEGPRASFRQLLPFLLEHKGTLVVVAVLSVLGAGATLVQPLLVGQVISRVQESVPLGALVWLLIGFVVLSSLISGYQHYLLQRTGTAVVYSSRRRLIARILRLPISEFDARRTGDLVSRVGTDTTLLYAVLTQGLADAMGNALILVGAVVAMAFIDPLLLGLIVLVLGVSIGTVAVLSLRIRAASAAQQEKVGELASGVERAVGSIRTIRASGATEREVETVSATATEAYHAGVRIAKVSALIVPVAGIALQVSLLVVLGVGGFRVASGAIDVASLVTFVIFLFLLVQPLASAIGAIMSVNQALGALGRIQEVLDLPEESAGDRPGTATPEPDAAAIEFRDVRFRYPDHVVKAREAAAEEARSVLAQAHLDRATDEAEAEADETARDVLRGVSFTVPRGARVALVGPSGAGKSTVFSLLLRFYDPQSGSVTLDGVDLRALTLPDLRGAIALVPQETIIFSGTAADNIRFGRQDASDAEVIEAAKAAEAHEFISALDDGYQAEMGERGVRLSGGQRQRVAIARAILRDAPLLLLDEATSALDAQSEAAIQQALERLEKGRTTLVIAHRLATVQRADRIVVMDGGRIVAQGTHESLLAEGGLYAELAKLQFVA